MTINTKDDLLAFLNEDDEFRQAVREALSEDEERMESPDIVSTQNAILRTQNAMLASLADVAATVNRMDKTVGRLGGGSHRVVVGYEIREEDARRADMDGVTVILLPDPNVLEVD